MPNQGFLQWLNQGFLEWLWNNNPWAAAAVIAFMSFLGVSGIALIVVARKSTAGSDSKLALNILGVILLAVAALIFTYLASTNTGPQPGLDGPYPIF